jgi:hypothetical protein
MNVIYIHPFCQLRQPQNSDILCYAMVANVLLLAGFAHASCFSPAWYTHVMLSSLATFHLCCSLPYPAIAVSCQQEASKSYCIACAGLL